MQIDSWPVAKRDLTGKKEDGVDPRGKWVDGPKSEVTFKASRGDAPIMPTAAEIENDKAAAAAARQLAGADAPAVEAPPAPVERAEGQPQSILRNHRDPNEDVD